MKYCRFQLDNQPHYGLVESVGGQEQITRLFLNPPQNAERRPGRRSHASHGASCAGGSRTARAGLPVEDRLCRPQLSRARRRTGQRSSRRAADLLQAALFAAGPRGSGPPAPDRRAGGLRRRTRSGDRQKMLPAGRGRRCSSLHSGLHLRERRDRARSAKERRPVDPRQGLRHLLPGRPAGHQRNRSLGGHWRGNQSQRRGPSARQHARFHLPARCRHPLYLPGHDAAAGRPDSHRNAAGCRPGTRRRNHGSDRRRNRNAAAIRWSEM